MTQDIGQRVSRQLYEARMRGFEPESIALDDRDGRDMAKWAKCFLTRPSPEVVAVTKFMGVDVGPAQPGERSHVMAYHGRQAHGKFAPSLRLLIWE